MPKFKEYNQNQSMLLPPDIREWIPDDHICFVINDVVDNLDIGRVEKTYSDSGCRAYNPRMLIKIIFLSYAKGIRSSRRIEELAKENTAYRYLSASQCPDHGTINLFRKKHLTDLENMFARIVMMCGGLNMMNPEDISIDGSVFKANASRKATYAKKDIDKIKRRIRKMLNEAEAVDQYGNLIDRHNLWEMVGVRYRRALFPGFTDKAEFSFLCPSVVSSGKEQLPGSGEFAFQVPDGQITELHVTAKLLYRKIDQFLLNFLLGDDSGVTAPISLVSEDRKTIKVVSPGN